MNRKLLIVLFLLIVAISIGNMAYLEYKLYDTKNQLDDLTIRYDDLQRQKNTLQEKSTIPNSNTNDQFDLKDPFGDLNDMQNQMNDVQKNMNNIHTFKLTPGNNSMSFSNTTISNGKQFSYNVSVDGKHISGDINSDDKIKVEDIKKSLIQKKLSVQDLTGGIVFSGDNVNIDDVLGLFDINSSINLQNIPQNNGSGNFENQEIPTQDGTQDLPKGRAF